MKNKIIPFLMLFVALAVASCDPVKPDDPKSGTLTLMEDVLAPGDLAVFRHGDSTMSFSKEVTVLFGQEAALVLEAKGNRLDVLVPQVPEGKTEVTVTVSGRDVMRASVEITASIAKRVVLRYEGGKADVLQVNASNDAFDQVQGPIGERHLSFDLLSENGEVLATGVVNHPDAAIEVFNEKGGSEAIVTEGPKVFEINLPNFAGSARLNLYEVGDADLSNEEGMGRRKLIQEIPLTL